MAREDPGPDFDPRLETSRWAQVVPWDSLRLAQLDKPGIFAGSLLSISRWLVAQLVPVGLVVALAALAAIFLALMAGLAGRDWAMARAARILVAVLLLIAVASGLVLTVVLALGRAVEQSMAG